MWDNDTHLLFENKSLFKHNMKKWNSLVIPKENMTVTHNSTESDKNYFTEANVLIS